ncbi:MAG: pantoate--beta-alanine ligase [Rhodobacteraceae bacterium]|nr:pantoate--beta-alanine ligase [Paracoccaceae bacterium]
MTIPVFRTVAEMRAQVADWHAADKKIALVPTMGHLHQGHLALIRAGLVTADRVITTIFVNPTQFGAGEDLESYPRDETSDLALIKGEGGHAAFVPLLSEMYPEGFATRVTVDGLTEPLCGASRPGHFDGVTQIVTKLLIQAGADFAMFGEKDWQQLAVVRRLTRDLDIATEVVGVPIVRDDFGLALSSRNSYLSDAELQVARRFNVHLRAAAAEIAAGGAAAAACEKAAAEILAAGFLKVDYVECRTADGLELVTGSPGCRSRVFGAARLGGARLIDNHAVV